jgi:23S rRNA pseudouridine1911/1915/1917 synthase
MAANLGLDRQWLHAKKLGFTHPISGSNLEFECDYPADLEQALAKLRKLS